MKGVGFGLIGLFFCVYLLPLDVRQLAIPDEMRYGEIAREMLTSGDFVVPRLNGLRYFEKPAGGHILNACAMAVFGETNFAVRLMSALAMALSAWAIYVFLKNYRSKQTAALASFIFLTSGAVMGVGTFSVLDGMFSCFVTLTLCSFYPALTASGKKRIGLLALTGVFAGGAFLVKGFIAFAVPVIVVIPFLVCRRQWKELFTLPWIPLAAATLVSLPWSLAIALREPDFWPYFFWEEHIRRFFSKDNAQHAAPFWYFVPIFLGGSLPWSLIGPLPLRDLLRSRLSDPLIQFGLIWLLAPFLFFSCSSGKLGTYILPCFVPFAMLLAMALSDRFERKDTNFSLQMGVYLTGAIAAISLILSLVNQGLYAFDLVPSLDTEHFVPKAIGWLIGLSIAVLLAFRAARESRGLQKTILLGLSGATMFITGITCAPTEIQASFGVQGFLKSQQHYIEPDTILVATPDTAHAVCYVYKRTDIYLVNGGEFTYGLSYPEAQHRFLDAPGLKAMLGGEQRVVLVCESVPDDYIQKQLPTPTYQRQWLDIWFAVYEPRTEK
jgi:4-amino-4-deoxy-L-arabinose transferase